MQVQYHKSYNPIGRFGCYFTSLGAWAEELTDNFLTSEEVLEVYASVVDDGYMSANCYIMEPAKVTNAFLRALESDLSVAYIGWWNEDKGTEFWGKYKAKDISFEILRYATPYGFHFRTAEFDPGPRYERSDKLSGKRYFKVIR